MAKKPELQPKERHTKNQPEGHTEHQPEERLPADLPQKAKASCSKCGKRIPLDHRGRSKQKACLRYGKKIQLDQEGQTVEHKGQDQDKMDSRSPESKKPLMQRNVGWCNPEGQVSYRQEKPTEVRGDEKVTRSESHAEQSVSSSASQEQIEATEARMEARMNARLDAERAEARVNAEQLESQMTQMMALLQASHARQHQPTTHAAPQDAQNAQAPPQAASPNSTTDRLEREVSVLKSLYKKALKENQELQGQIRARTRS